MIITKILFRDSGEDTQPICPHVQVVGRFYDDIEHTEEDGLEYITPIRICCNFCNETYQIRRCVG